MLITIILAAILLIGVILILLDRYHESISGVMLTLFGGAFLVGCIVTIMLVQIPAEHDYQKVLYQKEVLEYRMENESGNTVGNELLYNDIVEFNNDLRDIKRYAASPWTNWFNNAKIATIDYIEIPGLNE